MQAIPLLVILLPR